MLRQALMFRRSGAFLSNSSRQISLWPFGGKSSAPAAAPPVDAEKPEKITVIGESVQTSNLPKQPVEIKSAMNDNLVTTTHVETITVAATADDVNENSNIFFFFFFSYDFPS